MAKTVLTLVCSGLLALTAPATTAFADSVSYTYDVFGRVLTATYSTGVTVTYTYDAAGNRTGKTITGGSSGSNHAPVANDDTVNDDEHTSGNPSVIFNPLTNDTDADGDTLTITSVSTPSSGTVTFTGTSITYRYGGYLANLHHAYPTLVDTDSFTYTISDGHGGTATANVFVNINEY